MSAEDIECRFCGSMLEHTFCDLGVSPLANSFLSREQLNKMEPFYPLHVYVCGECYLVQLQEFESPESIFEEYAYFSSYSESWLQHCKNYAESAVDKLSLNSGSLVVEVASNDGYLLQYFREKGIQVLGVEPARNVAKVAIESGIETIVGFFGESLGSELAAQGKQADLVIANNVLAHVPDINSFVKGLKQILKPDGVVTLEFPHLLNLIDYTQFDTIYHEHFSYLSLNSSQKIFEHHGLEVFDVDELPTHGGSLRVYLKHSGNLSPAKSASVVKILEKEKKAGLDTLRPYLGFTEKVNALKNDLLKFLISAKEQKKSIVAYGAAAKGNTLLNYAGVKTDYIDCVVDKNPHKQNKYLPGSRIPIASEDVIKEKKPDYILILPWNLREEIVQQLGYVKAWGGEFVTPIPQVKVFS